MAKRKSPEASTTTEAQGPSRVPEVRRCPRCKQEMVQAQSEEPDAYRLVFVCPECGIVCAAPRWSCFLA